MPLLARALTGDYALPEDMPNVTLVTILVLI